MYSPLNDHLSVNLCSALIVNMSAASTMGPVAMALGWLFSLEAIGPAMLSVGHAPSRPKPSGLAAGCVRGMMAPVNSPPVASEPVPVAGHLALATPPRQYGLKMRTGTPPIVEVEKSPTRCFRLGQICCSFRVVFDRYPSVAAQKNVRFFQIGPP